MSSEFMPSARDPQEWLEACVNRRDNARWFRGPWMTAAMALGFCAVYVLEMRLSGNLMSTQPPAAGTLVSMGGVSRQLVRSGEWYRLIIAAFLHANLTHLLGNVGAFVFAAYALEWLVGRGWMLTIFFLGVLAGSFMSMAQMAPDAVGVGASGGIVALFAALLTLGLRLPRGRVRNWVITDAIGSIALAVIPQSGFGTIRVDYGAHMGGAMAGALVGLLLWLLWRRDQPEPPLQGAAAVLAWLGFIGLGFAAWGVMLHYPDLPALSVLGSLPGQR